MKQNILLYDIETSPNISYTWGKYEQDVIAFKQEWQLLSFAFKWIGKAETRVVTRADFKDSTDKSLVKALWVVLNTADIVVAHNGRKFDNKKANAKFIEHGLKTVNKYQVVDTLEVARAKFGFNSNKLDDLGNLLKVGRKQKTEGFDLWLRCMAGDKKAFARMASYNKQDVKLLERVYLKLRPWMDRHPNMNIVNGTTDACPNCGKHALHSNGAKRTLSGIYNRYVCIACGASSKGPLMKTLPIKRKPE